MALHIIDTFLDIKTLFYPGPLYASSKFIKWRYWYIAWLMPLIPNCMQSPIYVLKVLGNREIFSIIIAL
jgi:hypothetical protein